MEGSTERGESKRKVKSDPYKVSHRNRDTSANELTRMAEDCTETEGSSLTQYRETGQ